MMLCANQSHFVNGAVISADDGSGVYESATRRCAS